MTTSTTNEALTRISKEAELLSGLAWLVTIATDPQQQQDNREALTNQWTYLQRVVNEALVEVQS